MPVCTPPGGVQRACGRIARTTHTVSVRAAQPQVPCRGGRKSRTAISAPPGVRPSSEAVFPSVHYISILFAPHRRAHGMTPRGAPRGGTECTPPQHGAWSLMCSQLSLRLQRATGDRPQGPNSRPTARACPRLADEVPDARTARARSLKSRQLVARPPSGLPSVQRGRAPPCWPNRPPPGRLARG